MALKTYAIGDVHGCAELLRQALAWIEADAGERPARVVFLGDYIDRGPDSRGVIDILRRGPAHAGHEWIPLMGNHDAMAVAACAGGAMEMRLWFSNGGIQTLESYAADRPGSRRLDPSAVIPAEDLEFLRSLRASFEDEARIYVHAGLRPGIPLAEQDPEDLLWIRWEFLESDDDFGKLVVHGHTPLESGVPELRPNRLNLDTGAVWTGRLTVAAFDPDRPEPRFYQTRGRAA